jgi:hypothetical protein
MTFTGLGQSKKYKTEASAAIFCLDTGIQTIKLILIPSQIVLAQKLMKKILVLVLIVVLLCLAAYAGYRFYLPSMIATAKADVIKSTDDGFILQHSVSVGHDKARVFKTMTSNVGQWWSSGHSFSGDAGNMLIDAECFCERWGDNLVRHLTTTIWMENSKVVMEGGLGPLKELGLSGTMVWSLASNDDAGTTITWKYHVYGFSETGLSELATAVDGVLKEQIDRLVNYLK